jgi:hypothetical protein
VVQQAKTKVNQLFHWAEQAICGALYKGTKVQERLLVDNTDEKVDLMAFMGGLQSFIFMFSLAKNTLTNMTEFMSKAQKHMNAKDTISNQRSQDLGESSQLDECQILHIEPLNSYLLNP